MGRIGRALVLAVLAAASVTHAQAPDVIYKIDSDGPLGIFYTPIIPTWDLTRTPHSSLTVRQYGSGTGNSVTLGLESHQHPGYGCSGNGPDTAVSYTLSVYTKNRATALSSVAGAASVDADNKKGGNYIASANWSFNGLSIPTVQVSVQGLGSDSASDSITTMPSGSRLSPSCTASLITFPEYPGIGYALAGNLRGVYASVSLPCSSQSSANSAGSITYTTNLGADSPVAVITAPLNVSHQPIGRPDVGQTVYFRDDSYDPDNLAAGQTTAQAGICSRVFKFFDPDGVLVKTSTNLAPNLAIQKQGRYLIELTVTDNEGMSSSSSMELFTGPTRSETPNDTECEKTCQTCGSGDPIDVSACINLCTGNVRVSMQDPVRTRSWPLTVNLHVNSQSGGFGRSTEFKNASFTYGIELRHETWYRGNPTRRVLYDGDGSEFDFGDVSSAPANPPGFFGTLTQTSNGWLLTGAGAPESIEEAGNFSYAFDSAGRLQEITDPAGNQQVLTYDNGGLGPILEVKDIASDKRITFENDPLTLTVSRIVRGEGASVTDITYTSTGLIENIAVKDANDLTVRSFSYTYSDGLLRTVTQDGDPASTLTFDYVDLDEIPTSGSPKRIKGGNISSATSSTRTSYAGAPASGAMFRTVRKTSGNGSYLIDSDTNGNMVRWESPALPIYNSSSTTTPVRTYTYDSNYKLTSMNDGTTTFTYTRDALGQVTQETHGSVFSRSYTYSGINLTSVYDGIGTLWTIGYTDSNHPNIPTTFTNAAGHTWTRTLNSYGQVTSIVPPTGSPSGTTTYNYDESSASPSFGWLESVVNGEGEVTSFGSYTPLGDIGTVTTSPTSGVTNTTTFTYDAAQRETAIVHPDSKSSLFEYTGRDLTSTTDEAGTETEFSYCPSCGQLTGIAASLGRNYAWTLNSDNQPNAFSDARQNQTTFTYGPAGLPTAIGFPDSTSFPVFFNKYFKPSRFYDASFSYGAGQRLTSWAGSETYTYTYNSDNTVASVAQASGTDTFTYTSDRKLQSASFAPVSGQLGTNKIQKVEYTFNPDDSVNTVTWKHDGTAVVTWTYGYDLAGRVTSISNSFGETTTFTYDGEGKLISQTNANGTSTEFAYYEPRGWVTSVEHKLSGTAFETYVYEYDNGQNAAGNLTEVAELDGSIVSYGYDAAYRLTSEDRTGTAPFSRTYGYDLAGNLTDVDGSTFATYDAANKISSLTGGSISHSARGGVSAVSGTGIVTGTNLQYAALDKLTTFQSGSLNATYKYSHDGLRRYSTDLSSTLIRRIYIMSGSTLLGELKSGVPEIAYTWGPTGLISSRKLSGTPASRWYHFGPQGETRQLTDGSGNVTSTYRYSAYGVTLGTTGSDYNPFRYKGKFGYYTDIYTGMILAGQRWYQPVLARWTTRDPILFEGGYNVYEYAEGNPIRNVDPDGLLPVTNNSDRPFLYKPDKRENVVELCMPGQTCDIDGWYPAGRKPEKVRDFPLCLPHSVECNETNEQELRGACVPYVGRWELDEDFFAKWKNWPDPYRGLHGWPLILRLVPSGASARW